MNQHVPINQKQIKWFLDVNGCMICQSHSSNGKQYPRFTISGNRKPICRWILFKKYGEQTSAIVSRHTCDNKKCINPDHIISGSRADNVRFDQWIDETERNQRENRERNKQ